MVPNAYPVTNTSIGITRFSNVGSCVAALLDGFNADVFAYDPYVRDVDTYTTGATLTDLESVLPKTDAVIVTAELTEETRGMIDSSALEMMREDAVFVNTARGPVVDTTALIEALRNDAIAGAGLDVFETEPLPADAMHHEFENAVTTSHIAA